jgi:hypothetical protein
LKPNGCGARFNDMRLAASRRPAPLAIAATTLLAAAAAARAADPRPAVPREPIAAILEAATTRPIVALSEGQHWNQQGHRFRLALLRHPRFAETFDDIVVECGNARYQGVMDRFIAGEEVADEALRRAWQDTTQPNEVWDVPIYEEFFRAVRAVNASRPASSRLRVILADPPIEWDTVKDKDDILRFMERRDSHAAELVRTQVLDRKRRALLVFGDGHLWRKGPQPTVVFLLTRDAPELVFAIGAPTSADLSRIQPDTASWPAPSIALLKDTLLGQAPFASFYAARAGRDAPSVVGEPWDSLPMQNQFDALLYLGPPDTITLAWLSRERCADAGYLSMRLARLALVPWGPSQIDRLRKSCAALVSPSP